MLDASKIRDLMIVGLLTKIIEVASSGQGQFETNLVSNCYAMLESTKAHLQGEDAVIDENIAAQFMVDDDDDDNNGTGGSTV